MTYEFTTRQEKGRVIPVLFVSAGESQTVGSTRVRRDDPRDLVILSFSDDPLKGGNHEQI